MNKEDKQLLMRESIKSSLTMAEAARKSGVNYKTLRDFAILNNIFKPNQSKKGVRVKKIEELLVDNFSIDSVYLKLRLVEEDILEYKCSLCNIKKWNNKDIVLELDHKDGNKLNNKIENLRLLCPNCHSQTPTFRNRGGKNKIFNLDDNFILECFDKSKTFNDFCSFLGIKNRGKKLMVTLINKMKILDISFKDKCFENTSNKIKNKTNNKNCFCKKCNKKITKNAKYNLCNTCSRLNKRKVERPSLEQLLKEIEENGYCAVGRRYGVSDNAIRKWVVQYKKQMAS